MYLLLKLSNQFGNPSDHYPKMTTVLDFTDINKDENVCKYVKSSTFSNYFVIQNYSQEDVEA